MRPSRTLRAVVAVLTVWCLGCSSFEILLGNLLERSAPDACMSTTDSVADAAASPVAEGTSGDDCQCVHCFGVQTLALEVAAPRPLTPDALSGTPKTPLSIEREPLVPPPVA